jgi:endoglucanase
MITSLFRRTSRVAVIALACLASPTLAQAAGKPSFVGVNIAGAEFNAKNLPGVYGQDYIYPSTKDMDYFFGKGFNTIRLPFRWERLQPKLNGPFDSEEFARIDRVVSYAAAHKAHVVLDVHNYARYYGNMIGSSAVPYSAYAAFWKELAGRYKNNPYVIFGLMNEPNKISAQDWRQAVDAAMAAIRGIDANNIILVPGTRWTGAHSWSSSSDGWSNAVAFEDLQDPANNMMFEVHQYLDSDYSGTSGSCQSESIGVTTLQEFTDWARRNKHRAFLGEFAGGANDTCMKALDRMLSYMEANADVWTGWTYWAAGAWWGSYYFSIQPTSSGGDKPQMAVLEKHLDVEGVSDSGQVANQEPPSDTTTDTTTDTSSDTTTDTSSDTTTDTSSDTTTDTSSDTTTDTSSDTTTDTSHSSTSSDESLEEQSARKSGKRTKRKSSTSTETQSYIWLDTDGDGRYGRYRVSDTREDRRDGRYIWVDTDGDGRYGRYLRREASRRSRR